VVAVTDDGVAVAVVRARAALDRWFPVAVAVLVVFAGAGLWAGYVGHVDPGTTTEERTVSSWTRTASFDHAATVTRPNPVYDRGARLRDRRAYFPRVTPVLNGTYRTGYAASGDGRLDVRTDLVVVLVNAREGTTYWRTTAPLASRTVRDVPPGRAVTVPFDVDLNATLARLERVRETFGASPGRTTVAVRVETRLTGEVNGRPVDRRFVDRLRLRPDQGAVRVADPGTVENRTARTQTVRVERTRPPAYGVGGPALALASLVGAAALVVARRRGRLAPTALERARLERARLDEWVSTGRVPDETLDRETVEVASLTDLVDVAADADRRVVYDPDRELAVVVDGETVYVAR
jgi:hypothetical protein